MADAPLVPIKASKSKFRNMLAQTATSRNATRHPDFFIGANLTKTPPQAKKTMRTMAKKTLFRVLFLEWSFL